MKKYVLGLFLTVLSITVNAEVVRFRATSFSLREIPDGSRRWTEWSDLKDSDNILVMDMKTFDLKVYANTRTYTYSLWKLALDEYDEDRDHWLVYDAVDQDGRNPTVSFVTLHSQGDRIQIYVRYRNFQILYNVVKL